MTPREFRNRLDEIELQRQKIEDATHKLLSDAGWARRCDLPSTRWLWSKSFPESAIQWRWENSVVSGGDPHKKVPNPPFIVNGASVSIALEIEASWQSLYVADDRDAAVREAV